ncbi:MAG: phosphoglucosamine mutase [Bacillota bacterium]|nr:phosphoglucosamine mutase [Bacillota bacterium]
MGNFFGTDGVRGRVNLTLTAELAMNIGMAAAQVLACGKGQRPLIVIGRDTRISGDMLEAALAAGITAVGADAVLLGVIPTPGVAALMRQMNAAAGVVISASHNPYYDNGIKIFSEGGRKLPDELEAQIESRLAGIEHIERAMDGHIGKIRYYVGASELYMKLLLETQAVDARGLKIVVDCANGAISPIAAPLFSALGAEVVTIADRPDGLNINDHCGSTHIEPLCQRVLAEHADLGLAFDGDADRLLAVDHQGEQVDGDQLLAIFAAYLQAEGALRNNVAVGTLMSNLGLKLALQELGVAFAQTQVGDRYVLEKMGELDAVLGGEQSGHIILAEYNSTGDGAAAALLLLKVMASSGKSLHELRQVMRRYPQVIQNVHCGDKHGWQRHQPIVSAVAAAEAELSGSGRVLMRPSGTEPLIRVMAEGEDERQLQRLVQSIAEAIKDCSL